MFWSSITVEQQQVFEAAGVRRRYEAGAVLFLDNDVSTHVIVILEGQIKLTRASFEGREIMIELRGPGNLLGELAAVDESRRIATATVVVPVEAIVISAPRFRQLLLEQPKISLAVLTLVVQKLRQATDRRLATGTSDVVARLADRLVELAADCPPNGDGVIGINSPLSQREIAEWIGVSRDAVVIALRAMRQKGWIGTGRRSIQIYDLEALRTIAATRAS